MSPLFNKDIQEIIEDGNAENSINEEFYKRIYSSKFSEICHIFNDLQNLRYMNDVNRLKNLELLLTRCKIIENSIDETQ